MNEQLRVKAVEGDEDLEDEDEEEEEAALHQEMLDQFAHPHVASEPKVCRYLSYFRSFLKVIDFIAGDRKLNFC